MMLCMGVVSAHEMIPTYPKLIPSHIDDVFSTQMEIFNRRSDVQYYEIGVFDKEWKSIPFVSSYKLMKVDYLQHVKFDIYVRAKDVLRATYVCSKSKLRNDEDKVTAVSSKICSKIR